MTDASAPRTFLDKVWDAHFVDRRPDGRDLLYIDRHVLHDLHAPHAFHRLEMTKRSVRRPDLTFSVQDHTVATKAGRTEETNPEGAQFQRAMRAGSDRNGIRLFDLHDPEQGISHVVAPELGMVLPGATHAVPDSHACTVGGVGALGFGCGTSELEHILVTQTIVLKRPKRMRIQLNGRLGAYGGAKDVALKVLSQIGTAGGRGYAIEFAGPVARALPVEARMTLCNLTIEMGSRSGFITADDATFEWLHGRPYAPTGAAWEAALAWWRTLGTDPDAIFDADISVDCDGLGPQITWGTDQSQIVDIRGRVPDLSGSPAEVQAQWLRSLRYMDLKPGEPLLGKQVDRVFIGSCTSGRLSDLRAAAALLKGRRIASHVKALAVPGSMSVKRAAEQEGLDRIFLEAGFGWGLSGCSMCAGGNGDKGLPGERCISTTNRNFEGRQGTNVRTHLASAATVAASAIAGVIADPRTLSDGGR